MSSAHQHGRTPRRVDALYIALTILLAIILAVVVHHTHP